QETLGPEVLTVATKRGHGRYSATSLHPEDAREQLRSMAELAFSAPSTNTFDFELPCRVELCFQRHLPAELLCYLEGFERLDGTTICFEAKSAVSLCKTLRFVTSVVFDEQLP
ncbi:MAG: M55 family metallopeptidase, partial [Pseudomonadota bacterium]